MSRGDVFRVLDQPMSDRPLWPECDGVTVGGFVDFDVAVTVTGDGIERRVGVCMKLQ